MSIESPEHEQPETMHSHPTRVLQMIYRILFSLSYPLNEDPEKAPSEDSAYFLSIAKKYFNLSTEENPFSPKKIEEKINPAHLERLENLWSIIEQTSGNLTTATFNLNNHWETAERIFSETAETILARINETAKELAKTIYIKKSLEEITGEIHSLLIMNPSLIRTSFVTLIPTAIRINPNKPDPKISWKKTDHALRKDFIETQKEYIAALRAYYELLLERKKRKRTEIQDAETEFVIEDTSLRTDISIANRYLRLIDSVTQIINIAKAIHHEQTSKRFRKTKLQAYIEHELEIVLSAIKFIVPHIIEQESLPRNFDINILVILCGLHDLLEDSGLTIETILEKTLEQIDKYDTSLSAGIKGIKEEDSAETIKKNYLNIIKGSDKKILRSVLRMLSKNSTFDNEEKARVAQQNLFGKTQTQKTCSLNKNQIKEFQWGDQTSKTHQAFPEEHDSSKLTNFLIRLNAFKGKKEEKWYTFLIKNLDRAKNLESLEGMPLEKQFGTVRETTSRLIAWQMLDHDHESQPMYETLPYLIKTTIQEYERLQREYPENFYQNQDKIEPNQLLDASYLNQLYDWQEELEQKRLNYESPAEVKKITEKWREETRTRALKGIQALWLYSKTPNLDDQLKLPL